MHATYIKKVIFSSTIIQMDLKRASAKYKIHPGKRQALTLTECIGVQIRKYWCRFVDVTDLSKFSFNCTCNSHGSRKPDLYKPCLPGNVKSTCLTLKDSFRKEEKLALDTDIPHSPRTK